MVSGAWRASIGDNRVLCNFGIIFYHFSLRRRSERDEEPPCSRSLGGYRSARSVVERTAGDITDRESFEDGACV